MKKLILGSLMVSFIVPNIVFAAWWNPMTWFNSWNFSKKSDDKIQMLENRIKELENTVPVATTTTVQIEVATTTEVKEVKTVEKPKVGVKKVIKPTPQPVKNSVLPTIETKTVAQPPVVQATKDYTAEYYKVVSDYGAFYKQIRAIIDDNGYGEYSFTSEHVEDYSRRTYLTNLNTKLEDDIRALDKYANSSQKPGDIVTSYQTKITAFKSDFNKEEVQYTKASAISYIVDHQTTAGNVTTHINLAKMFDIYDRAFNTRYAAGFRATKTGVEAIEYIDMFLLDVGAKKY